MDEAPHAIPVSAPVRAGERRILLSLKRDRASLDRLRAHPQVALAILAEGNDAFTARGRAHIEQESMTEAPGFAAVVIDVESIDDHRQSAVTVESGVGVRWSDEDAERGLLERVAALEELAAGEDA